jgi:hypothetical protein
VGARNPHTASSGLPLPSKWTQRERTFAGAALEQQVRSDFGLHPKIGCPFRANAIALNLGAPLGFRTSILRKPCRSRSLDAPTSQLQGARCSC